ncbi:MAG: hypothetical protein ABIQ07_04720 [Ginsengibacter sp.]
MKKYLLFICVCFQFNTFAQTGTEIILFDVTVNTKGITISNPVNITNHKGYDNQPFFYKTNIYYSSEDSSQMDIKKYDYLHKTTSTITHTEENEFSPTVTPDQKFISCILQRRNGKQNLVKYPINGGEPSVLIDNLKVGYHAWLDNNSLLLFVLEDTSTNGLHYYNLVTKEDKKLATDIGRSVQRVPGKLAVSFVKKTPGEWLIRECDAVTKKIITIMPALHNDEFIAWTKKGLALMSDGKDIYFAKQGNNNWQKVKMNASIPLKNISRIAINTKNTRLAVVVAE